MTNKLDVNEPQLPRKRKVPKQFEAGSAPSEFLSVDVYYRQIYFKALDLAVTSIKSHFD